MLSVPALSVLLLAGCGKDSPGTAPPPQAAQGKGTPVVSFEGGAVTLEQLQTYISQMNPAARTRVQSVEQRREYAEGLARFELFVREAQRQGLEKDPEVLEAAKRAMVQRLLHKEFEEKAAPVTPEDIAAYYEMNKAEFVSPARWRYSHLLVPAPQGSADRAAKKKLAQALLEKARKLQPLDFDGFDALGGEASGNPDTKPASADTHLVTAEELKERLGPEVAAAAGKLQRVGDTSAVVESPKGFHLLKLTDLRPERNQPLDAVSSMLRSRIARERRDASVSAYTVKLQEQAQFKTDTAALEKLQVNIQAPQEASSGPVPGYLPAPQPVR
ncbi:PpiC-type peptidyl-prolyl cis-trans isomerase [Stigmatella aurantiaca DW4/3-1]|uniref:PpiC-type peptidyl-prolyl cis-trans isomerase n=1 Tax=Stigmatella aurantiaca (strain DW4/3-1) TaxID=378806 RepID=E3FW26_STIAD|nr:PpiC-type peptidyl-prolyl cis-trans isomerase [Stigmatella aurantiaca DW4/3-1]